MNNDAKPYLHKIAIFTDISSLRDALFEWFISVVPSMLLRCLFDVSPMRAGVHRTIVGECTALL